MATLINKNAERRVQYKIGANSTQIMFPNLECISAELLRAILPSGSTPAGDNAYITDASDLVPVESLKVNIQPAQSGTGDPSPENVRAISGWDAVKVTRTGKNLWDNSKSNWLRNNMSTFTSTANTSTTRIRSASLPVKCGGKQITISGIPSGVSLMNIRCFNSAEEKLKEVSVSGSSATITPPEGTEYIHILCSGSDFTDDTNTLMNNADIQVEMGSTASAYEAYTGESYNIPLGRTVYGGTLDVTTGELVVDKAVFEVPTITEILSSGTGTGKYIAFSLAETCDPSKAPIAERGTGVLFAERGTAYAFFVNTSGRNIQCFVPSDTTAESVTAAITGSKVCASIANPQTYTLTPQQVTLLKGINNVFADAGTVEVKYSADIQLYIDKQIAELQALVLEN